MSATIFGAESRKLGTDKLRQCSNAGSTNCSQNPECRGLHVAVPEAGKNGALVKDLGSHTLRQKHKLDVLGNSGHDVFMVQGQHLLQVVCEQLRHGVQQVLPGRAFGRALAAPLLVPRLYLGLNVL